MPFPKEASQIPSDIGRLTISLATMSAASVEIDSARVSFDVIATDGSTVGTQNHDLLPHLTAAQKATMMTLINNLRTKAKAEAI
ncbi:MAG TPA: hypothetical protein VNJ04_12380 [Gemmatimonadaceae bacterium]|nr:hypothetical protein [Gemmatimonadaceae bacterium]